MSQSALFGLEGALTRKRRNPEIPRSIARLVLHGLFECFEQLNNSTVIHSTTEKVEGDSADSE